MFETTTQLIFRGVFPGKRVQIGFAASHQNPISICCVLATHPSHKLRAFIPPNPSKIEWDLTNRPLSCYEILRFRAPFSGSDRWRFLGFIPSKESKKEFITTELNGTTKFIRNSDHTTRCHEGIFFGANGLNKKLKPYFRIFRGYSTPISSKKLRCENFGFGKLTSRRKNFKLTGYLAPN